MLLLLMAASFAMAEEEYNLLKQGYSFFDTYIGGSGGAVGKLEPLQTQNPPIDFDYDNYEVTWAYLDLEITDYAVVGDLRSWTFSGGTIGIYEDPSFDLDYGGSPATGIATATNGTPALIGVISSASFNFNANPMFQIGTFSGLCTFTGGSRFAELEALNIDDSEWSIFHSASSKPPVSVPAGYHSRFAGRIYVMGPVATQDSNWSQIRALY
jgi:hypothetical protein